jgi:hypothetical protein
MLPNDVFTRLLMPQGNGFPLWNPEPDQTLPAAYRGEGVRIGDVGIITRDGRFDFLFNICEERESPINGGRVPDCFEKVSPSDEPSYYPSYHAAPTAIANGYRGEENVDAGVYGES